MELQLDDAFLPATLSAPPMTDDEFFAFCSEHPDLFFEMTAEGELLVMPPTYTETSGSNSEIDYQLRHWAKNDKRGKCFDSSGGYVLPNGARRSPDASWVSKMRISQLDRASRRGFYHLSPDFLIELKSASDRSRTLHNKMLEYIANGTQLGWLIDPSKRSVTVYRPNRDPETHTGITSIAGEDPVAGFVLDLTEVWLPLED
jgi:Uma2 family endonuclease